MVRKFVSITTQVTRICVIVLGLVLVILVAGEVVFRYVVTQSLIFSDELARYVFIWATFLGASLALRRGQHIGLELSYHDRWPLLRTIVSLAVGLFLLIFLWASSQLVPTMWAQRSPILDISMGWIFLALPVGAALMLVQLVARFFSHNGDRNDL